MYIELTKKVHEEMSSHHFLVSVMGNLNQDFLKSLIKITDRKIGSDEMNPNVKKKIFHFMVECAQNICKTEESDKSGNQGLFLIGKKNDDYAGYLGSVFSNTDTENIISVIGVVNQLLQTDVKELFFQELIKTRSNQNQLLVSLLDISKRTRQKINYEAFPVSKEEQFIAFRITLTNDARPHGDIH